MDIKGSHKINAPRQKVFDGLFNPEIIKNSMPNCESAEYVDGPTGRQLKLVVSPQIPGFKGPFTLFLEAVDVIEPSHLVILTEPSSSVGTIKARCSIDLAEEGAATNVSYDAHADISGKIAATPEFVMKPIVKGSLDHFLKNFEKQLNNVPA